MHLDLDEDRALLLTTLRRFAADRVRPHARKWEEARALDPATLDDAWAMGFASAGVSSTYGGAGDDGAVPSALTGVVALEQLAWGDLGFALSAFSPMHAVVPLALYGGEANKREILPSLLGEKLPAATGAWVEPHRGYDVASIRARAAKTTTGPVLHGEKTLVPRGADGDVVVVYARSEATPDLDGVDAYLLLGKNVSGTKARVRDDLIGPCATKTATIALDEAPARRLAGEGTIAYGRLAERALVAQAAAAVGVARAAAEYAADYAKDRRAFGKAIAQNQSIAFKIAEAATDVEAARWMTWKAAWRIDRGESARAEAGVAHRFATEAAFRIADDCVQILGGHGVIRDHLAELFFRNARTLASTTGWFIV
jgi:acyl-CoA dehydrogenase